MTEVRIFGITWKKIVFSMAMLVISIALTAQQKSETKESQQLPSAEEQALVQRI